jgi:hypothetical protein
MGSSVRGRRLTITSAGFKPAVPLKLRLAHSLEKYTKEDIQIYIKNLLSDLPSIFENCDIKQKRTFISLFFPKGFMWNYPGLTAN